MGHSPKKITESQHVGDGGVALIHLLVNDMGHEWVETRVDAGIDGTIELRDPLTGAMSNRRVLVQSKVRKRFSSEDDLRFWFVCDQADIDYWMSAAEPVILVCSHPETREAWWVHVQPWFANASNRASGRVDFNKATHKLAGDITGKLFAIADPHGVAHTPVAEKKAERLISNLIEVDVPDLIYIAPTSHFKPGSVYAAQAKTRHQVRSDFVVWGGRLYTWRPTPGTALAMVPDAAARKLPFGELTAGGPDTERLAVRLLNAALQEDLRDDCRWYGGRRFLHFRPTPDLTERRIISTTGKQRLVFKGYYQRKDDPTRPLFYRHAALDAHFSLIAGQWFCELLPDYLYTDDGYKEFAFADMYLSRMKRIEKNPARLGETLLWASHLQGETAPDLFCEQQDRILDFGSLMRFSVDRGITDKDWIAPRSDPNKDSDFDGDPLEELDSDSADLELDLEGLDA